MKRDSKGKFRTRNKCIFRSLYEPGEDKHVIKYHFDEGELGGGKNVMSNMSYVRFENTYRDLEDCFNHLYDEDLSESENKYMLKLVELCKEIAEETH